MKIFYYEFRKSFLKKSIILLLGTFALINMLIIYMQYRQAGNAFSEQMTRYSVSDSEWEYYQQLHEELDGLVTKKNVQFVIGEYKKLEGLIADDNYSTEFDSDTHTGYLYGDYSLLNTYFYEPMKYLVQYKTENEQLVEAAKENVSFYQKLGNSYGMEKNEYIIKQYQNRNTTLFYETAGWKQLFEYDYSDILILVILFLGIIPSFYEERRKGMENIILSTKSGRKNYVYGKYLAFYLCTIILVLLFAICNYIIFNNLYGLDGGNMSLYSIEDYKYTPLNISVMNFYVLITVFKCIALCCIVTMFGLISNISSDVFASFVIFLAIVVIGLYCSGYILSVSEKNIWISLCSPFSLLHGGDLYKKLVGVNVLNHFVPWLYVHLFVQSIIQIFLHLFTLNQMRLFPKRKGY